VVIVDTSVWIPYFQNPDSEEKRILDRLLDHDQAAVVGVVLMELIQGCRTKLQADSIKETLLALPYLEASPAIWLQAGELFFKLRRRGITLPFTDLVIASVALEHHCEVYTHDSDFRKIPELRRFIPSPGEDRPRS
jgi:predicted nucleic acid-binding protein